MNTYADTCSECGQPIPSDKCEDELIRLCERVATLRVWAAGSDYMLLGLVNGMVAEANRIMTDFGGPDWRETVKGCSMTHQFDKNVCIYCGRTMTAQIARPTECPGEHLESAQKPTEQNCSVDSYDPKLPRGGMF